MRKIISLLITLLLLIPTAFAESGVNVVTQEVDCVVSRKVLVPDKNCVVWNLSVPSSNAVKKLKAKIKSELNGETESVLKTYEFNFERLNVSTTGDISFDTAIFVEDFSEAEYLSLEVTAIVEKELGKDYGVIKYDEAFGGYYVVIDSKW